MLLAIGFAATFMICAAYIIFPRRLHPLEQLFGLFLSLFIYAFHFFVSGVNQRNFSVNAAGDTFLTFLLIRFILTPVLALWLMELLEFARRFWSKAGLMLGFAAVSTFETFIMLRIGILTYEDWRPLGIFRFWLIFSVLIYVSLRLYRSTLRKELGLS
ncbi:hypothetical protein ACFFK0_04300 [Paenibacillus chartarius]|uniref:Uncharacterized protein n=1 Tax=Paenibacillus chartarius TaxID=747481 RepID=A0ABV6DGB9_9BACL